MGVLNLHRLWSTAPAENAEQRVSELKSLERSIEVDHRITLLREYQKTRDELMHARAELDTIRGEVDALFLTVTRLESELWGEGKDK